MRSHSATCRIEPFMIPGILLALALLLATAGCGAVSVGMAGAGGGVGVGMGQPAVSSTSEAKALFDLVNGHRHEIGCPTLIWDDRVTTVARRHSTDMAKRRFFDHVNPEGLDPFERLESAGIRYGAAAENIGKGRNFGRDTFADWMDSPGHRKNIEDCQYARGGVGYYDRHWTLVLVRDAK